MTVHQSSLSSPPSIAGIAIAMAIATPPAINHVNHRRDAEAERAAGVVVPRRDRSLASSLAEILMVSVQVLSDGLHGRGGR
jgi:hypothetical protein